MPTFTPIPAIDEFVARLGVRLVYKDGTHAHYWPRADQIQMLPRGTMPTARYYSLLLHEVAHWTGHATRLKRQFGLTRDDVAYAREELVAIAAQLHLCFRFGLRGEALAQGLDYGRDFYQRVKHDPALIRAAFADGRRAVLYLHECQKQPVPLHVLSPWADKLLAEHFPTPPVPMPIMPFDTPFLRKMLEAVDSYKPPAPRPTPRPAPIKPLVPAEPTARERLAPLIARFGTASITVQLRSK